MPEPTPNLIDHTIQKDIVRTLVSKSSAKYSELKPARIEANLFMYHVNQLIKRGVVEKQDGVYSLSTLGSMYVDRANLDKLVFRVQPKIVTILAVESKNGTWLLLQRKHEPHMGRIGFPSGKLHYGETLEDAAGRELHEKSGISNVSLALRGNIAMRFFDETKKDVINHTIGYVFAARLKDEPAITNSSPHWHAYWGNKEELLEGNVFKGHPEIFKLLEMPELFIESLDFMSDY